MREALEKEFAALEEEKGACLLSAAESGSRTGRFASCGVRFVPVHEHAWLLRCEKGRDASEWKPDEKLDVSGWEMARSLRPVRVSNASVLEWLASPVVCRKPPVFAGMKELAAGDHHPRAGICHCLDMREEPLRRARAPEEALPCCTPDTGSTPDSGTGHGSSVPFEDLFAAELERELLPHADRLLKERIKSVPCVRGS